MATMLKNLLLRPTRRQEKTELYDLKIEVPFAALEMVYLIQLSSRTIGNTGSTFLKMYLEKKS